MDDDILIIDDDEQVHDSAIQSWKVLIVDDESEVHRITKVTLSQFRFDGKSITFLHAYSASEAREILKQETDIALVLLDVVMETDDAGLQVVRYIREQLDNHSVRIVLRTGQPGQAPEDDVVESYDINDYKDKTELTSQKLRTLIRASLRSYRDICSLQRNKRGLEKVIQASKGIFEKTALDTFVEGALEQLTALLELEETTIYSIKHAYELKNTELEMIHSTSSDKTQADDMQQHPILQLAIKDKTNIYQESEVVIYCKNPRHNLIFHIEGTQQLSEVDTHLLNLFTENIVVALENIRLNEVIEDNQKEIMYRLGEVVESRSKESGSHVKRVANYTALLASLTGMDNEQVETLKQASPLHDIGKVGIPDAILNKPAKLDSDEWAIMQTHAKLGYDMLYDSDIPLLQTGAAIAMYHHEKWDGSGYPNGLRGEDIPIEGRLTALADVFDALGSRRCYKEPWGIDSIMELINSESGKHFDPNLVKILNDNLDLFLEIKQKYVD
ncbi:DUF3369 domain-containing protein [Motilimonas sp. 1_MG-2023]|uniref:DUF3369 domain-containing protein n=1 Tax=Motilimonas sp. 1_MG-2023 TaxID=3062672 RepID=UPI0026E28C60|nr:DUF3369 domain-containing protein [Motilimonas sp. 1_MG-2023]MDO6528005.1 DUF3369 domain-containing protein [Motilimonas sp. 1_MG-2023]